MSYFTEGYPHVRFPIESPSLEEIGLRRAQLGAIHAIAAYFSQPQYCPGLIVMPTGSGKTGVIYLSPFVLRVRRVLIITPARLVRTQIAEGAQTLRVLKRIHVLPDNFPEPKVHEIKHKLTAPEHWEQLRSFDIAIATPNCVSPGLKDVADPPLDIFDLVIMDEAHHSEAPRWSDLIAHFSNAKHLLFTATPYRRDGKELKGRILFNYPLKLAHEDKIFGDLTFVPVAPKDGEDHDLAIAKATERVYHKDKADGFNHRLMVRTDSTDRADVLAKIYKENTNLSLLVVHSGHAMSTIKKALERLTLGEVDGIICVAMLGEGFDFPELKISAIHAPHKSLAVTLQFIGRFARTSGTAIGGAKFLAIPQDIRAETEELYRESATLICSQ